MDESLKQLLTLGRSYFDNKQYGKAEQYLTAILEQNQSFADVYNMLGVVYHDQGQFARAQRAFEAALRLNPAYTEAALNLAVIYNDLGKYQEAKEVYQAALGRTGSAPGDLDGFVKGKIANMYADIGDVFASGGRWAEAADEYRRALRMCPTFMDIRVKLADALRDGGQLPEALAELEQVIKENPEFLTGRVHYGICLYSAGRRDEAVKTWEAVLVQQAGHKGAQMYLNLVKDSVAADAKSGPSQQ